jgi:hypothetical protein
MTLAPVVLLKPVAGLHRYVTPPALLSVVDPPSQIV